MSAAESHATAARHEAGHALTCIVARVPFVSVTIDRDVPGFGMLVEHPDHLHPSPLDLWRRVGSAVAGVAAEDSTADEETALARLYDQPDDYDAALRGAEYFASNSPFSVDPVELVDQVFHAVRRFYQRPHVQRAIQRIADALLAHAHRGGGRTAGRVRALASATERAHGRGDPSPVRAIREGSLAMLIVGLGNPSTAYAATRHNLGAMVLDRLAERLGAPAFRERWGGLVATVPSAILMKPQSWMNDSGIPVRTAMRAGNHPLGRVLVIHDDTDADLGKVRPKAGGSAAGHNGVRSIISVCGDDGFPRLRVGVGRNADVLDSFSADERAVLPAVLDQAVEMALVFIATDELPPLPRAAKPPRERRRGVGSRK